MLQILEKKLKRQLREKDFKELVFGSATTFFMRVLGMLAGTVFTFVMAKYYGASTVGAFHLSQTVLLLFTILTRLGMDTAIVKLFSENIAFNKWNNVLGIYNRVISSVIPLGLFWTVVLFFSSGLIAEHVFHKPYLKSYFQIISLGILPMAMRFVNSECYRGMRKLKLYAYSQNVSYFLYSIIVMLVLYFFHQSNSYIPNISFVIALAVLAITSSISVRSKINQNATESSPYLSKLEILKTSYPMMLSNSMMQISGWINTLILGSYVSDSDVGVYRVVLNVSSVCAFILVSINSVAAPRFAELYARKDLIGLARAARQTSAVNFFASIPIFVLIIVFRERIMGYFGNEFIIGASVLLFTMAGQFMNIFCGSVGSFLNMTGRQKEFQNILLICTLINLVSCFIFIPRYGLMGSAICTMLFMSSWNIISVVFIYRKYKIQTFYWPFTKIKQIDFMATENKTLVTDKETVLDTAAPVSHSPKVSVAIVGIQKSATSSLKNYLAEHPKLISHDRLEFTYFVNDNEYAQGYDRWFENDFDKNEAEGKLILVKNVGLVFWEEGLIRLKEHNPDVKIIMMLRNPADRAYSAYWYAVNRGVEKHKSFEEALKSDPKQYQRKADISIVSYYQQGHYFDLIQRLYYYFPEKNVKIILQEDLSKNGKQLMHDLFEFIGIDSSFQPDLAKKYNESASAKIKSLSNVNLEKIGIAKKIIHSIVTPKYRNILKRAFRKINSTKFEPPPLNSFTRQKLIDYFKPHNEKLGKLLNRDLSHWDK
ncbi:MAG: oligosaccharide flippase family protein [Bacteroidetes bacterium]|nr:oligosaccharide flippase family protein [Bacteroidota bacterium]